MRASGRYAIQAMGIRGRRARPQRQAANRVRFREPLGRRRLVPFRDEFWRWVRRTEALGTRVERFVMLDGSPEGIPPVGESPAPTWRPDDGTPLVLLGDAGLYDPAQPRHRHWLVLGRRVGRIPRPLLPLPAAAGHGAGGTRLALPAARARCTAGC